MSSTPSFFRSFGRLGLGLVCLAQAGCQFFFPMPVEPEVAVRAPSNAVRTIGAPFEEGEVLEARVFIEDVAAGSVMLKVGKKCIADGRLALPLTGEGQLGGLLSLLGSGAAETAALIDLDGSLPIEAKWDLEVDDKRTFVELDYASGLYRFHQLKEEPNKRPLNSYRRVDLTTEQTPHDGHSLLGYLRRWDPPEGTQGYLYAVVGKYLLRTDVALTGRERLKTSMGERMAVRIDGAATRVAEKTLEPVPRAKSRPFTLWLTDDEQRIPLRIVVTTELAELTIDLAKHSKVAVPAGDPVECESRVDKKQLARAKPPRKKKNKAPKPKAVASPLAPPPCSPTLTGDCEKQQAKRTVKQ